MINDQFRQRFHPVKIAHTENLSFFTDDQNIRYKNFFQHITDIVKNNFTRIIIVQKFPYFSGFIQ